MKRLINTLALSVAYGVGVMAGIKLWNDVLDKKVDGLKNCLKSMKGGES